MKISVEKSSIQERIFGVLTLLLFSYLAYISLPYIKPFLPSERTEKESNLVRDIDFKFNLNTNFNTNYLSPKDANPSNYIERTRVE
ncbi:MAG: hypothetical protein AABX66_00720 [Nanoarchaeota archaeon]